VKRLKLAALAAASTVALMSPAMAAKYILQAGTAGFPADLDAQVTRAGGVLEKTFPFGVAIVSASKAFKIKGVSVALDVGYDTQQERIVTSDELSEFVGPPNSGDNDRFFNLQYGHNYVGAVESWNKGFRGAGVRVAVLDTGFDLDHVDLEANIDFASSADMTGEGLSFGVPGFSHGTHVAGTIAARDNGIGTIGVAPEATLVLVKVLSDAGSGSFEDIIDGIYHAANQNVQVMNMSLGTVIPRASSAPGNLPGDSALISALANAVKAAMAYATAQGVTVVVSAGNNAADLDGDGSNVRFQTGLGHNLGIAATTAVGYYAGGSSFPNSGQTLVPASYTNYGTSMVDFAAPGGDALYPGNELCVVPAGAGTITQFCWVLDLILSTSSNLNPAVASYAWAGGTSMASPHAAGVAALIISETGNSDPEFVAAEMRKRAVDGGKAGRDDFFGHGQANTGN